MLEEIFNPVRAAKANTRVDDIEESMRDLVNDAARRTFMYGSKTDFFILDTEKKPEFRLEKTDTISAIYNYRSHTKDYKSPVCVHNFASYTNPGGGYVRGSLAQEEAICSESILYNVLLRYNNTFYAWNRAHLNRGLYYDRALYTEDVLISRESNRPISADILTCASPNYREAKKNNISWEENLEVFKKRIKFVRDIVETRKPRAFITGAFGCGVFLQDPEVCCKEWLKVFRQSSIETVIFAIPEGPNYDAFAKVLRK